MEGILILEVRLFFILTGLEVLYIDLVGFVRLKNKEVVSMSIISCRGRLELRRGVRLLKKEIGVGIGVYIFICGFFKNMSLFE